MIGGVTPST